MNNTQKLATAGTLALSLFAAANDASAQCVGRDCLPPTQPVTPGCTTGCGGTTTNNRTINNHHSSTTNNRLNFVAPPGMAVSSGWCMRSISVSFGIAAGSVPVGLGLSNAQFEELCGRWAAVTQGAGNPNCAVGMYSVLYATGSTQQQALRQSVQACYGNIALPPRPRG